MIHHIEDLQQEVKDMRRAIDALLSGLETAFPTTNIREQIGTFLKDADKKRNDQRWKVMENIQPRIREMSEAGYRLNRTETAMLLEPIADVAVEMLNQGMDVLNKNFPDSHTDAKDGADFQYLYVNMVGYGYSLSGQLDPGDTDPMSTIEYIRDLNLKLKDHSRRIIGPCEPEDIAEYLLPPIKYLDRLYLVIPITQEDTILQRATNESLSLHRSMYNVIDGYVINADHDLNEPYFHHNVLLRWCASHCHNRIDPLTYAVLMDDFGPHFEPTWFQKQVTSINEYYHDDVLVDFSFELGQGEQWHQSNPAPVDLDLARNDDEDTIMLRVLASETIDGKTIKVDVLTADAEKWGVTWNQMTVMSRMALMSILNHAMSEDFEPLIALDESEDRTEYIQVSDYGYVTRSRFSRSLSERMMAEVENPGDSEENEDD